MKLYEYIMNNHKSVSAYARATGENYPTVKRWCDKGAQIMFDQIYVPSVQLDDPSAPHMTSLENHIKMRYDSNMTAAARHLRRHRNQLYKWVKAGAILIDQQVYIPKGRPL
jgi:hypothetical protein